MTDNKKPTREEALRALEVVAYKGPLTPYMERECAKAYLLLRAYLEGEG